MAAYWVNASYGQSTKYEENVIVGEIVLQSSPSLRWRNSYSMSYISCLYFTEKTERWLLKAIAISWNLF